MTVHSSLLPGLFTQLICSAILSLHLARSWQLSIHQRQDLRSLAALLFNLYWTILNIVPKKLIFKVTDFENLFENCILCFSEYFPFINSTFKTTATTPADTLECRPNTQVVLEIFSTPFHSTPKFHKIFHSTRFQHLFIDTATASNST